MRFMSRNGFPRVALWIGAATTTLAALPAAASAATIGSDGTTVEYRASAGETNQVALTASGTDLVFDDPGATAIIDVDGPTGCSVSGGFATCPLVSFVATDVALTGGDDSFSAVGNLAPLTALKVEGGRGDDILRGGTGGDRIEGGADDDFIDGNIGGDFVVAGSGADTMQWDPGDASDILEGQGGADTLAFNGSNIAENIDLSANGPRLRLTRNIGTVSMDVDGVESVVLRSLGDADVTTVGDLGATDVAEFVDDLSQIGGAGDAAADRVTVNGTPAVDHPFVRSDGGAARVTGLAARVIVRGAEPSSDVLAVNGLGGDDELNVDPDVGAASGVLLDGGADVDTVHARGSTGADTVSVFANGTTVATSSDGATVVQSTAERTRVESLDGDDTLNAVGNLAALTQLTFDAGRGADHVAGGNGPDIVLGGDGDDLIDGNIGDDFVLGGDGDDTMQWDPGDANDTLEGQDGADKLAFNGGNIDENIELSANGDRLRMTRNVASINLDVDGVEEVLLRSVGGADVTTINDLGATDVTEFTDDLSQTLGGPDTAADQVIVNATNGIDSIDISGSAAAGVDVAGLAPSVALRGQDPSLDRLAIHTLAGRDAFDTDALEPGSILFSID
jgi:Ca2+-binding RTX toxin-like protein